MGSRYLFIVLYVFLEHHLSRGDYRRAGYAGQQRPTPVRSLVSPARRHFASLSHPKRRHAA
jgi:dolichol-phosphate mannosyltransferase